MFFCWQFVRENPRSGTIRKSVLSTKPTLFPLHLSMIVHMKFIEGFAVFGRRHILVALEQAMVRDVLESPVVLELDPALTGQHDVARAPRELVAPRIVVELRRDEPAGEGLEGLDGRPALPQIVEPLHDPRIDWNVYIIFHVFFKIVNRFQIFSKTLNQTSVRFEDYEHYSKPLEADAALSGLLPGCNGAGRVVQTSRLISTEMGMLPMVNRIISVSGHISGKECMCSHGKKRKYL